MNNSVYDFEGQYPQDFQKIFLSLLIADPVAFAKCLPAFNQDLFDDELRRAVRYISNQYAEHAVLPSVALVNAAVTRPGSKPEALLQPIAEADRQPTEWIVAEFEKFARHRSMENIMLISYDLIQKGEAHKIKEQIDLALKMSLTDRKTKFDRLSLTDLMDKPLPKWLFKNLMYERTVGVLFGLSQVWKSFIALDLGCRLAHGMEWLGIKLKPRNVMYVAGEGAAMMLLRRKAWLLHHNLDLKNDRFDLIAVPVNLLDPADVAAFVERMKEYETEDALVIIDTLSTCITGEDENSAETMTRVVASGNEIARGLGCAVMIVHHTGKDPTRGSRGSYALHANIDFEAEVTRIGDEFARLQVTKQKDGPLPGFNFKRHIVPLGMVDEDGEERDSLAVVPTDEIDSTPVHLTNTPGRNIAVEEGDRLTLVKLMDVGQTLNRSQLAGLLMKVLGLGKRATENRIDLALPLDQPMPVTRDGEEMVLLRMQAKNGYQIKMMVKYNHEAPK